MGKVVLKWKGHSGGVTSVCWSPDGERVVSGSNNEMVVRVWDVKNGKPVQGLNPIKTGHEYDWVSAVSYSPEAKLIATGGLRIAVWDAKTGKRISKIELELAVYSLAWTSDEKKLIAGSWGSIRIFNTATWQQIAVLDGHPGTAGRDIKCLTLFSNDRLLASTSSDKKARLWDLDTNLQVGPPLQHEHEVQCAAFSADGKLLSTGCFDKVYVWDIQAILKAAGLEDLLSYVSTSLTAIGDLIHNEYQAQKSRKVSIIRGFSRIKHADAPTRTSCYPMYVAFFSDLETDSDVDILGQCYPTSTHPTNPTSSATRLFRWCAKP
jgi:WD40 repeat protein